MINLQNKKRSDYKKNGDLPAIDEMLKDYWDKSRAMETKSIEDLEKYLWLGNAAAATISIGYIQKSLTVSNSHYYGAWSFIIGILMLIVMKYVSSINSSRVRYLFQKAKSKFDADEVSDLVFKDILSDKIFVYLRKLYLFLQYLSGFAFIGGCILTLLGVILGHK